ncbi:unnamed protein product [Adineta ricciae]|uniref:G-protein coupled receptors family 1 profile domain-containing protein n=1 Tax=Adineta ricciae TaxID=249248 RepID=A0A815E9Z5_ADIRI|nr:unnamed protein product [Adineta ricciae]
MGSTLSLQLNNNVITVINRYGTLFLFIFGIVGNLLSVYIFSRTHLRRSACVLCLLLSSCFNILILIFGTLLRCLIGYNIDLTYNSPVFCAIRYYVIYVSQSASVWLIVLACFDRYLSSSLNILRRRWMNIKRTYSITFCILILSLLAYIEIFFCFAASVQTQGECMIKDKSCSFVETISYLVLNSFLPSILMLGFGTAMLMNIKQSHQRTLNGLMNKIDRRDKQLIYMLLLQVASIVLCMFPLSIMKVYLSLTGSKMKSANRIHREQFAYQVSVVISYINPSGMFFLHTLHGKLFRVELFRLFHCLWQHDERNRWKQQTLHIIRDHRIHPVNRF